ncbi:MAG: RNA polymerase sigma factor [Chitinophagaceae bacterium]
MKTDHNEQHLLEGLAQNDRKAIESIYRAHYNVIQTLIINNNGSADDARDVFQEALVVLFEKVKSGSFELHCQIRTYLYSVAKRLWLKRLQQIKPFTGDIAYAEETISVEEDAEMHDKKQESFRIMENSLDHLGEPCRSLLKAYYMEKQPMAEIAAHFGYTNADNAKNQKYKCLTRLKKIFFAQYKNDV